MIKNHITFNDISDWRFNLKKAEGSYLWDHTGKKLIDFTSGWNVTNLGWNHPEVNDAIAKQARENTYSLLWTSDETRDALARELLSVLPKELNAVSRATGGTEANEEALKVSRAVTGRKKIIGFRDSYHGQSFGVMALGYRPEYVKAISPLLPEVIQIEFPSTFKSKRSEKETLDNFLNSLEDILRKRDVAAIVTEAGIITGWGSTYVAPVGFLKAIRKLTREYGTLLILDEVGTGFSRCGKLFGMELESVIPDIVTLAKGISNGAAPIGAMIINNKVIQPTLSKTNLTSTFGWTPVACAAALATVKIHKRDKVWEKAKILGSYVMTELKAALRGHELFGDLRGIGMEIGVMFVQKKTTKPNPEFAKDVVQQAYNCGLHLVYGDEGTIQVMPPLTTSKNVLEEGIDIFVDTVKKLSH